MNLRWLAFSFVLAAPLCAQTPARPSSQSGPLYPYQNPAAPVEARITDLLSRMTLAEKIDALGTDPTVPRLGIAATGHVEGLHGLSLGGPAGWEGRGKSVIPTTQFPQSRGLGQTWDPALLQQAAQEEGYEARYADRKYHRGGLVLRAPNADLSRDPRWGRSEESYGEDPFLAGSMTVAYVKGLQGSDPRYWQTAALMKHFLANSNEDGRDSSSSDFDARLFHEYYAVPFRMGVEEGHANAFMTAYNAWNGIPMTAQPALKDIVMKDWGFNGIICTDAGALGNMVTRHKYAKTVPEAVADAIHAGINQFLDSYKQGAHDALTQKLITEQDIDQNLRGVFRVMIRLGLLDPNRLVPYAHIGYDDLEKGDPWNWPANKALVRKLTEESIVLLKNENKTLPLDAKKLKSIAVIGPYADTVALDWYSGTPPYTISPLDGIRKRAGDGVDVKFSNGADLKAAAEMARNSDVAIVVIGNHPTCNAGWKKCPLPSDGKEAIDRKSLTLEQEDIARAVYAANPRTIVVLNASFPYTTTWTQQTIPAVVEMTHGSQEQGTALADVLFGDYNPAGRLTQTWVASITDLPPMMDYNIRNGRTYMYTKAKPLYAFGYGLSYTSFTYSGLRLSAKSLAAKSAKPILITFEVKNTGPIAGDEIPQLYVTHLNSKVARPLEELKGFERIHLNAGQSKLVTMPLSAKALAYWDEAQDRFITEPDEVEIRIGASSDDIRQRASLAVTN
jgi:beta-glucosidase